MKNSQVGGFYNKIALLFIGKRNHPWFPSSSSGKNSFKLLMINSSSSILKMLSMLLIFPNAKQSNSQKMYSVKMTLIMFILIRKLIISLPLFFFPIMDNISIWLPFFMKNSEIKSLYMMSIRKIFLQNPLSWEINLKDKFNQLNF